MIKAVLNLNNRRFVNYSHLDLEQNWRSVNVICLWLKAHNFDLTLPIFVTKNEEENTLTFFQTVSGSGKTIILVHPNPKTLHQLHTSLRQAGHMVHAFTKVKDANRQIQIMSENDIKLNKIVVPKNLRVAYNYTYMNFLNRMFPKYEVVTIDNKDYRDNINMKSFKKEYTHVI